MQVSSKIPFPHLRRGLTPEATGVVGRQEAVGLRLALAAGAGRRTTTDLLGEISILRREKVSRGRIDNCLIALYSMRVSTATAPDKELQIVQALTDSNDPAVANKFAKFWLDAYIGGRAEQWEGFHDSCLVLADLTTKCAKTISPFLVSRIFDRASISFSEHIYPGNFSQGDNHCFGSAYHNSLIALLMDLAVAVPVVRKTAVLVLTEAYETAKQRSDTHLKYAITNHLDREESIALQNSEMGPPKAELQPKRPGEVISLSERRDQNQMELRSTHRQSLPNTGLRLSIMDLMEDAAAAQSKPPKIMTMAEILAEKFTKGRRSGMFKSRI